MIHSFLKNDAKIFIATDSASYLISIINSVYETKLFFRWENDKPYKWIYKDQKLPHTKFYKKAKNSDRNPFFIELEKI